MNRNGWVVFFTGFVISCCLIFFMFYTKRDQPARAYSCTTECNDYKLLRDQLSKELNNMKREYGKLNCELNKLTHKLLVTTGGGWCKADSAPNSTQHMTDKPFATAMSKFFSGKRVASFGDGPGIYKQFLDKTGLLVVYDAFDGAPYCEEVTNGVVKFLDLTAPQYGLPVYDWIVSLEVAEHIPAKYERIYVDNLVRHAKEGILLSWAVPTQGGHSHVNGKSFQDVKALMAKLGFEQDEPGSKALKNSATLPWLRSNVNIYRRTLKKELSSMA